MIGSASADDDHLAALSMAGTAAAAGLYTPDVVDLRPSGDDQATDLVVYVHEIHHQALNDSTAWGAALHVLSALGPAQRACFRPLLDACRQIHEAYATFAAVSVVAVHHATAAEVLRHYPGYDRLYARLAALVGVAGGPHRAYLLATAIARAAMQTPVLSVMLESPELVVLPSALRTVDQPDGRWRRLLRAGPQLTVAAATAADSWLASRLGRSGLDADRAEDPTRATADEFDEHWTAWETAAYAVLSEHLVAAGATVLEFNGHMAPTGEVLAVARRLDPGLSLRAARPHSPAPNDAALSAATIQFVRRTLVDPPHRARLDHAADSPAGGPAATPARVILDVRLPRRMLDCFRWAEADARHLSAASAPIVARRSVEPGADGSVIAHHVLRAASDAGHVLREPEAVTIAAASCFVDTAWTAAWLPTLRASAALVVLVDVVAERFIGSWIDAGLPVRASALRVTDTGGEFWAIALFVGEDPSIWLHLGDETTVKLLLDQLRQTGGLRLDVSPEHVADAAPTLGPVIEHLLATESFLDLQGLDAQTIQRVTTPAAPRRPTD